MLNLPCRVQHKKRLISRSEDNDINDAYLRMLDVNDFWTI